MLYLFFLAILFLLLYDFKKGVILYTPFKFLFYSDVLIYGNIKFDFLISTIILILFVTRYKRKFTVSVPWVASLIICMISHSIYTLYPKAFLGIWLYDIISIYIYSIIFFKLINTPRDINLFIKSSIVFILLLVGNGIIELITQKNVIGDFIKPYLSSSSFLSDNEIIRFGNFKRIRSFVPHSIGFGVECTCYLYLFVFILFLNKVKTNRKLYYFIISLLCIGIIISGSRTPLLGLTIMSIPFILNANLFQMKYFIIYVIIFVGGYFFIGEYITNMLTSIFNSDAENGSSIDMRLTQLMYSLSVWQQSPIFGHGPDYDIFKYAERSEIYGAESVWFTLLMKQGLIGIFSYIFLYCNIIKKSFKLKQYKYPIFFMIGWLVIDSATNLPGINIFFPLMLVTIIYKSIVLNTAHLNYTIKN